MLFSMTFLNSLKHFLLFILGLQRDYRHCIFEKTELHANIVESGQTALKVKDVTINLAVRGAGLAQLPLLLVCNMPRTQSDYTKIWIYECNFTHPEKIHIQVFLLRRVKSNLCWKIIVWTLGYRRESTKKACRQYKHKAYSRMLGFYSLNLKESKSCVLPRQS